MRREGALLGLAAFVTSFVVSLLVIDYPEEGPVVVVFSQSHGLHEGDLVIIGLWVCVMAGLFGVHKSLRRRDVRRRARMALRRSQR